MLLYKRELFEEIGYKMDDETDGIDPNYSDGLIIKTTPVIRDLSLNPSCDHGTV